MLWGLPGGKPRGKEKMKLGELKIETLRLLFADADGVPLTVSGLDEAEDSEQYAQYLRMMPGAINRGLSYLEMRGVLPLKTVILAADGCGMLSYGKDELPADFRRAVNVQYVDAMGQRRNCRQWHAENGGLCVAASADEPQVAVWYLPRLERLAADAPDDTEIPLPEELAQMLPYWLKGELFRSDEPDEAVAARKYFDEFLADFEAAENAFAGSVDETFAAGYWI